MKTIPAQFLERAKERPSAPAYFVKRDGQWAATTWAEYAEQIRATGRALIAVGLQPGDTVCILGFNTPSWVIFDVAAMAVGAVPAGIYTTSSAAEVHYIAHHAAAKLILVENTTQWNKIAEHRHELPALEHVVTMPGCAPIDDDLVITWDELLAKGDAELDAELDRRLSDLLPDSLATLIYTSGTTGPPKGVMLSHENLAWTASCLTSLCDGRAEDHGLSYLPLSHIAEQTATIHGPAATGAAIYYAESIEKVADNLREVQPTIMFGVPRIWEKFHATVASRLDKATGVKKALVDWTRGVCSRLNADKMAGRRSSLLLRVQYKLADRLLLSKLKPALGLGKARMCVSGAAPIAREVLEFFASLDIVIYEVYGQSEDCGPTSFNVPSAFEFGSVGKPLPGVQVRIAEDGEILVKGPNVFLGYYKDEAATANSLEDGWLHSGDLGQLDTRGYLHITGRKKDIIITAGGKNIAPKNIEGALKQHPLIAEAVVIGDRRPYLTALLTLDEDAIAERSIEGAAHEDAAIRDEIDQAIAEVNRDLAKVETIKKFKILPRSFSTETGELTPTLKVKRAAVSQLYASEIDELYES